MDFLIYPTFHEIYPDEPIPSLKNLLGKLPTAIAIQTYAFINSRTHLHPYDLDYQTNILVGWLRGIVSSPKSWPFKIRDITLT
jgi:hypothetical protein